MPTRILKLVHVSPRVQARGGIETLHAHHRAFDVPQHFVALFDRNPSPAENYTNLNFTWRTPLWRMRQQFRATLSQHREAVVIYHHTWGLPLFHDLDFAHRRVQHCHGDPVYHRRDLRASRGLIDGTMGMTPAMLDCWRSTLPELGPERLKIATVPIRIPPGICRAPSRSREIVIGYLGRLDKRHKRIDRLPGFLRELEALGLTFRFEVIGDGRLRTELERGLGIRAKFHGWVPEDDKWRILSTWDAVVFFSEMEGGPLALLEACSVGVLPFFPAIGGSLGDVYAPRVDARCLYVPGDLRALAQGVASLFAESAEKIQSLRERAKATVLHHQEGNYERDVLEFLESIAHLPPLAVRRRRRPRMVDALPLGLVSRIAPWALRLS